MMKKKRHSPEQIIRKLREADDQLSTGMTIAQVCQKLEISEQTFHRWRNQYGGMKPKDGQRDCTECGDKRAYVANDDPKLIFHGITPTGLLRPIREELLDQPSDFFRLLLLRSMPTLADYDQLR